MGLQKDLERGQALSTDVLGSSVGASHAKATEPPLFHQALRLLFGDMSRLILVPFQRPPVLPYIGLMTPAGLDWLGRRHCRRMAHHHNNRILASWLFFGPALALPSDKPFGWRNLRVAGTPSRSHQRANPAFFQGDDDCWPRKRRPPIGSASGTRSTWTITRTAVVALCNLKKAKNRLCSAKRQSRARTNAFGSQEAQCRLQAGSIVSSTRSPTNTV